MISKYKLPLSLKVIPSTYCNYNCEFCFLSKRDLKDKVFTPLDENYNTLENLFNTYNIVDLIMHGGELLLFSKEQMIPYIDYLVDKLEDIDNKTNTTNLLSINTNLSIVPDWLLDYNRKDKVKITISYYPWNKDLVKNIRKVFISGYYTELQYFPHLLTEEVKRQINDFIVEYCPLYVVGKTKTNKVGILLLTTDNPGKYNAYESALIRNKFYLQTEFHKYLQMTTFYSNDLNQAILRRGKYEF